MEEHVSRLVGPTLAARKAQVDISLVLALDIHVFMPHGISP